MIVLCCGSLFLFSLYVLVVWRGNNDISFYLRDPAATFLYTPLAGLVSSTGVFLLLASGAIAIFASLHSNHNCLSLLLFGLYSILIAIDDFYMLHEDLLPRFFGVSEEVVIGAYGIIGFFLFFLRRRDIAGFDHIGLYLAAGFLAFSAIFDFLVPFSESQVIIEDSFKFLGLLLWSVYWALSAHRSVQKSLDQVR